MEETLLKLVQNSPQLAAFVLFGWVMWARTDKTLTFYESLITTFHATVLDRLERIEDHVTDTHPSKEPPS